MNSGELDDLVEILEKMVSENFKIRSDKKVNKEGDMFRSKNNFPKSFDQWSYL